MADQLVAGSGPVGRREVAVGQRVPKNTGKRKNRRKPVVPKGFLFDSQVASRTRSSSSSK